MSPVSAAPASLAIWNTTELNRHPININSNKDCPAKIYMLEGDRTTNIYNLQSIGCVSLLSTTTVASATALLTATILAF